MKPMNAALTTGLALSLMLSACGQSSAPSALSVKTSQNLQSNLKEQFPTVHFQVDFNQLRQDFSTQSMAEASFARLEVFNKETMAGHNFKNNLKPGDEGFVDPTVPILATNAGNDGYVEVSGNNVLLGAKVPAGNNWRVKIQLYSNKSNDGLIQELTAGFNLPLQNGTVVPVNAQTHLSGWVLDTLLAENPKHPNGGSLLEITPIDYAALQKFMDGFAGIPDDFVFEQPNFPPLQEGQAAAALQTAISTKPVSYPNLEALSPQPAAINGVLQIKPPAVTLAHLNKFAVAELVKNRVINNETFTYAAGAAAWNPDAFRIPGYLVDKLALNQKDSQGGTYAMNNSNRLFIVNNASRNDPIDVFHGIDINNGAMTTAFSRNDLEQIDTRALSLGKAGDTGQNPVAYMMTRVIPAQGQENLKRDAKLVAVSQTDGSNVFSFSDWDGNETPCGCPGQVSTLVRSSAMVDFTPVVQSRANQGDLVYTILHADKAANDVAPVARGVYKIEADDTPDDIGYYKHNKNSSFTRGGALSGDGSKLYLLTKGEKLGIQGFEVKAELMVLNTADMTLAKSTEIPAVDLVEQSSTPTVGRDGSVYISTFQSGNNISKGVVYKFDSNGNQVWRHELPSVDNNTKGQLVFAPVLYDPQGQNPVLIMQTEGGTVYALTDNGANASQKWARDLGGNRLFEAPMIVQNDDNSLEVYTGTDTNVGRIYGLNIDTGEINWQKFPAGFYSSGFAVKDGFTYLTTRSGNYGDFTYMRSIKTAGKQLAPASVSSWPKLGGNIANTGSSQFEAP